MNIKQGEIFLAALDPVVGHEIAKTRPVIIVSSNIGNKYSGTVFSDNAKHNSGHT